MSRGWARTGPRTGSLFERPVISNAELVDSDVMFLLEHLYDASDHVEAHDLVTDKIEISWSEGKSKCVVEAHPRPGYSVTIPFQVRLLMCEHCARPVRMSDGGPSLHDEGCPYAAVEGVLDS